jgi:hypothetical protein
VRSTSSVLHPGATAHRSATTAELNSERWISRVRPTTSDTGPATSSASPRPTVLSDTERALWPADTEKARASSGNSGWVL